MNIDTTRGPMDEALLEKRTGNDMGQIQGAPADVVWTEYWHEGELVHRSVELKARDLNHHG